MRSCAELLEDGEGRGRQADTIARAFGYCPRFHSDSPNLGPQARNVFLCSEVSPPVPPRQADRRTQLCDAAKDRFGIPVPIHILKNGGLTLYSCAAVVIVQ